MSDSGFFELRISEGGTQKVVPLRLGSATIGRGPDNAVRLGDRNISRCHARLFRHQHKVWAEDLSAGNGVLLNGEPIERPTRLYRSDVLTMGDVLLELEGIGMGNRDDETTDRTTLPDYREESTSKTTMPVRDPDTDPTRTEQSEMPVLKTYDTDPRMRVQDRDPDRPDTDPAKRKPVLKIYDTDPRMRVQEPPRPDTDPAKRKPVLKTFDTDPRMRAPDGETNDEADGETEIRPHVSSGEGGEIQEFRSYDTDPRMRAADTQLTATHTAEGTDPAISGGEQTEPPHHDGSTQPAITHERTERAITQGEHTDRAIIHGGKTEPATGKSDRTMIVTRDHMTRPAIPARVAPQHKPKWPWVALAILTLLCAGAGGYYYWTHHQEQQALQRAQAIAARIDTMVAKAEAAARRHDWERANTIAGDVLVLRPGDERAMTLAMRAGRELRAKVAATTARAAFKAGDWRRCWQVIDGLESEDRTPALNALAREARAGLRTQLLGEANKAVSQRDPAAAKRVFADLMALGFVEERIFVELLPDLERLKNAAQ